MKTNAIHRSTSFACKRHSKGFTLLEVMIALFIVAMSLGGVLKVMGTAASNTSRLTNRTFAQWVALNQITQLQIDKTWPKYGESKGDDEMASQEWRWKQKIIKTSDDNIKRVELSVWGMDDDSSDSPYVTVVGFLGNKSPSK